MFGLLSSNLWLTFAFTLVLGASALFVNRAGHNAEKVKTAQAELTTVRSNAAMSTRQQTKVITAQNEKTQRAQSLDLAVSGARAQLDGLLNDIASIRRGLPTAPTDARPQYVDAIPELLGDCSRAYQELAAKADAHANDALTLQRAWPTP